MSTTGKAKGAVLKHGNLTWVALNCIVDYDVVSTDVAFMISPLCHVASLGIGAHPVILKRATIVLDKGFEPGRGLALIQRHRVTMLSGQAHIRRLGLPMELALEAPQLQTARLAKRLGQAVR